MLKTIALVIGALIAAVLIFAATRPDSFRVERKATIQAPPEKIYSLINDFKLWPQWSPWEKLDLGMKRTLSGSDSGVGAIYAWEGNKEVGAGRMEILSAQPAAKIVIKLDFIRPFEGHNTTEYTLAAKGDATDITWAMFGPSPYLSKLMGLFMSMDKMIGVQFEKGLADLKSVVEVVGKN